MVECPKVLVLVWPSGRQKNFTNLPFQHLKLYLQTCWMTFHIWQLSVRMTELVFSKQDGWSHDDVNLFGKLAQRYLVITEEHRGLTSCTVTEHNILHIASDAMRFSHPDNYWCFSFESAVRRYVTTKSNFKNIECTYAKKEARRELLKHLHSHIEGQPKQYKFSLEKVK